MMMMLPVVFMFSFLFFDGVVCHEDGSTIVTFQCQDAWDSRQTQYYPRYYPLGTINGGLSWFSAGETFKPHRFHFKVFFLFFLFSNLKDFKF